MTAHPLADVAGALLTLLALGALGGGGYLLAVRLLGLERAASDALALAVAWLLASTGLGVGIGIGLGACGQLRLAPGLALALLACGVLLAAAGDGGRAALARPARHLGGRLAARLRQHWVLSLLACHAIGSEALRGLVRPPLSWDSLMYHLMLAATWLQRHDLAPVFGAYPMNYYGYSPANGAVWLWWWMAPSHGELYANLAFLPQWALLGLATGAVARRLGARRAWPLAAFLVAMTPTVVRFAATQYVDVFTAACLLGACCFGLSWLREPRWGDAALAGVGLGLAAGAKVLGLVYAAALAAALLPLAVGSWRRRAVQAAAALALAAALGGFFYLRNAARGAGPLALECEGLPHRQPARGLPALPRPGSVAAMPRQMLAEGRLARAFLGTAAEPRSPFVDLGLGPQALVVLLGIPALAALPRERWREAAVAGSQVLAEIAFWIAVPYAAAGHVFANVRYLLPAVGLAFAGGAAAAESRGADDRLLHGLAVALAAQDLLLLHTQMPDGVRLAVAAADLAVVALALSPRLRGWLAAPGGPRRGGRRALATLAVLGALAGVPCLARFRAADRTRAFTQEYTAHGINVALYAAGWDWLERHGGSGTVAVVNSPDTFFIYPAMGPGLERRALYVNVNAANLDEAAAYPLCQPRVQPDTAAWIANLRAAGVRWLDLTRTPPFPFAMENDWARAHPELFVPRFSDPTNLIYELLPPPGPRRPPA
jgi:4-amino-4-deoxy-L-arabinose transferase-like glycosyltransferase